MDKLNCVSSASNSSPQQIYQGAISSSYNVPTPLKEIPQNFSELVATVEILDSVVHILGMNLVTVVRPESPDGKEACGASSSSEMGSCLKSLMYKVNSIKNYVESLNNRLEL